MSRFDEIQLKQVAEIVHVITAGDLARFVELTGDNNKLHTDAAYAATTPFKKPVAHGMLGVSFISTVIGTQLPGDGALWFAQSIEFLLPVRVGDTLTVRVEVVKKHERDQVVELLTEIFNQNQQKVTTGIAKVKIVEPERAEPAPAPRVRTALIVGASGGIGQAVCAQLAQDGFDVVAHYFGNRAAAEAVAGQALALGRKAFVLGGDVRNPLAAAELVTQAARHMGGLGVVVNCSTGRFYNAKFGAVQWAALEEELEIAVRGAFNLAKAAVPLMEQQRYGKLILLTSQSTEAPAPELLPYITAKSALNGMAKALAVELAPKGIRVNLVSPGMTDTDLLADIPEKVRLLVAARTPLRRLATPADVAGAVAYLASPHGDYLTGETIRVNGGQTML
jgi:3-oxoacyl-[acyl-carrier protein] reductase